MDFVVVVSFLFFMSIFAGVGLASIRVKKDTTDDYLVAGRGMSPSLAALSAVSTWNSGYMFIGFIGFTYTMGYTVGFWHSCRQLGKLLLGLGYTNSFKKKAGKEEFGHCHLLLLKKRVRRKQNLLEFSLFYS